MTLHVGPAMTHIRDGRDNFCHLSLFPGARPNTHFSASEDTSGIFTGRYFWQFAKMGTSGQCSFGGHERDLKSTPRSQPILVPILPNLNLKTIAIKLDGFEYN